MHRLLFVLVRGTDLWVSLGSRTPEEDPSLMGKQQESLSEVRFGKHIYLYT